MWTLLLIMFSPTLGAAGDVVTVTGLEGQSVEIQCPYRSGYETNKKYLCRGKCPYGSGKDITVQTGSAAKDERFSLNDDTTARVFTITITDLRSADAGQYWCGIEQTLWSDISTEIKLLVETATTTASTSTKITTMIPDSTSVKTSDTSTNSPPIETTQSPQTSVFYISMSLAVMIVCLLAAFIVMCRHKRKNKRPKAPAPVPLSTIPSLTKQDITIYSTVGERDDAAAGIYSLADEPASSAIYCNATLPQRSSNGAQDEDGVLVYSVPILPQKSENCFLEAMDVPVYSTVTLP